MSSQAKFAAAVLALLHAACGGGGVNHMILREASARTGSLSAATQALLRPVFVPPICRSCANAQSELSGTIQHAPLGGPQTDSDQDIEHSVLIQGVSRARARGRGQIAFQPRVLQTKPSCAIWKNPFG